MTFLSAENVLSNSDLSLSGNMVGVRHSSRRLQCPRPFVNLRSRTHQWSWLLNPMRQQSNLDLSKKIKSDFDAETDELWSLFSDWIRAPRGLGGLTDAVLSASDHSLFFKSTGQLQKSNRRKSSMKTNSNSIPNNKRSYSNVDNDRISNDYEGKNDDYSNDNGRIQGGIDEESWDGDSEISGQGRLKIVDTCQNESSHKDHELNPKRGRFQSEECSSKNVDVDVSVPL